MALHSTQLWFLLLAAGLAACSRSAGEADASRPLAPLDSETAACGFEPPGVCASFTGLPDGTRFHDEFFSQWDLSIMERRPEGVDLEGQEHAMTTELNFCGEERTVSDLDEMAVICDGRLVSSVFSEGVAFMNIRSRLPFDFKDREGLVSFSADLALTARQWIELWITPERPRYPGIPELEEDLEPIQRAIRLVFDHDDADVFQIVPGNDSYLRIGVMDGFIREDDGHRNDVRLWLSETRLRVEIDGRQRLDRALPEPLDWSRGHIILQQFSYNPHKDCEHRPLDCKKNTVNWGYFGFDGLTQDVKAVGTAQQEVFWVRNMANMRGSEPEITEVVLDHPTGGEGFVRFSAIGNTESSGASQFRLNNGPWIDIRESDRCWAWRTLNFPASVQQGENLVEFRSLATRGGCFFGRDDAGVAIHRVDLEVPVQ